MKKEDDDQNPTLGGGWLARDQKINLSNVFVGFTIAGGLTLLNYQFGKSDLTSAEAWAVVEGTLFSVVMLMWFGKE